jgi:hypothetical protein
LLASIFLAHTKEAATDWTQVRAAVQAFTTSP